MTTEIAFFLVLFVGSMIMFSVEWFSADITALGLMLALIISGLLPVETAFAGFGSQAVMMILGLLILTEGLVQTGLVDVIGTLILRHAGKQRTRLTLILMIAPALLSSVISNTASSAFFLPVTLGLANHAKLSASKLLLPMAFATILASSVTLIGTSTNIVISGLMEQHQMEPLSMFELTPVGLPILIVGLIYMFFVGQRLLPDRTGVRAESDGFTNRLYVSDVLIKAGASTIGKTIEQSVLVNELNLGILSLYRNGEYIKPLRYRVLHEGDRVFVEGRKEDILKIQQKNGLEITGALATLDSYLQEQSLPIAEVVLLPGSPLLGRSISGLRLRERYNIQILAINHFGEVSHSKIGRRILNLGDVLLIQIPHDNLQLLEQERLFRVLDVTNSPFRQPRQIRLALIIFVLALGVAVFNILPIAVAVLLGAFLMFITRSISPEEAYRNIEWKAIILIGSMLAFGQAMQETGTAEYLANQIVQVSGELNPIWILSLFFLLALILTQPMSNQAAAVILLPVAIQTALQLNLNPRPFAIIIAIAASCSFITPLEPACIIVYGAGKYKFADFLRVGGLLTLLIYLIAIIMVPMIWRL